MTTGDTVTSRAHEGTSGTVPVLIIGAGPVGLAMACALRRLGVECRIVDEGEGPTPERESRALGLQARTLEVFEALGVVDPLLAEGRRLRGVIAYEGGRRLAHLGFDVDHLETAYPFILSIPQGVTERRLIDRLESLGGRVEWRSKLTELRQDDDGVSATLTDSAGRAIETRSSWLIGCDGPHSAVRHALGLSFEGTAFPEQFLLSDLRIDWELPGDHAHIMIASESILPAFPLPEPGRWRLIDTTGQVETDDPGIAVDRFRTLLRSHSPVPAEVSDPVWTSAFRIHRRVVDRLRVGRCFVAGDAAHIHSPVGGQGLNTGVQDAFNLAWKLALVVRGEAPDALLDSYQAERLPIAEAVLSATDRATRVITWRNPMARWIRNRLAGVLLGLRPVRRRLILAVSELGLRDEDSPISAEDWAVDPSDPEFGHHAPRPGDRMPDVSVGPETASMRLHDLTNGPWFSMLLSLGTGRPAPNDVASIDEVLRLVNDRYADRISTVLLADFGTLPEDPVPGTSARLSDPDGRLHRRLGSSGPFLYLVRPDGVIGYRARPPASGRLAAYLERLFR